MRSRAFGVYFTFLNISFIVMLWFDVARRVAAGAWMRKGGGRHRRVLLSDLQQYAQDRHEENLRLFDDLAADENPYATLENPLATKN